MIRFPKIRFNLLRAFSLSMLSFIVTKEELTPEELHQYYLENSPYKETKNLSKKERFKRGLPSNQFHEQLYELTINPTTGVPEYESKVRIQRELEQDKYLRPRPFIEVKPLHNPGMKLDLTIMLVDQEQPNGI